MTDNEYLKTICMLILCMVILSLAIAVGIGAAFGV